MPVDELADRFPQNTETVRRRTPFGYVFPDGSDYRIAVNIQNPGVEVSRVDIYRQTRMADQPLPYSMQCERLYMPACRGGCHYPNTPTQRVDGCRFDGSNPLALNHAFQPDVQVP